MVEYKRAALCPPFGERFAAGDNLTAAIVNGLDPSTRASCLLHSCGRALLQGIPQQEVGRLDVTMHGVGRVAHCNGLHFTTVSDTIFPCDGSIENFTTVLKSCVTYNHKVVLYSVSFVLKYLLANWLLFLRNIAKCTKVP